MPVLKVSDLERVDCISFFTTGNWLYNKSSHQTIMHFATPCKPPDPSEVNIKRALDHLKLEPLKYGWCMLRRILVFD